MNERDESLPVAGVEAGGPLDQLLSEAQLKLRNGYDDALSRAIAEARNLLNGVEAGGPLRALIARTAALALQESVDSIHEHLLAAVRAESPVPRVEAGGPLRALIAKLREELACECNNPDCRKANVGIRYCLAELDALLSAPVASKRDDWLALHVGYGHTVNTRGIDFDECSCGATYWRRLPSAPVASPEENKQP